MNSTAELMAAARCLALDAVAARTCELLTRSGIPVMMIKGPATSRWLYPDRPETRRYTDVDLLVDPDAFDRAQNILRSNGYRGMLDGVRSGEFPSHETAWTAPGPGECTIDLHRGFAGVGNSRVFFADAWHSRETMLVAGASVAIPGPAVTATILALHAASPGRGRKPLQDINRANEVFDQSTWRQAAVLSQRWDAESACRAGLELLPGGRELADQIGIGGAVRADQWLAGRQRNRISVNLALAIMKEDFRSRTVFIIRRVLPSPAFLRLRDASARRGPGWLALAYVRRVARTVRNAPEAVRDVLIASRALRQAPAGTVQRRRRRHLALRLVCGFDARSVLALLWAVRATGKVRRQLRQGPLDEVHVAAPPGTRSIDRLFVVTALRAMRATCLIRALVLQRFDAAAGRPRDVIIAVTPPGEGFRAHAWLAGDRPPDRSFAELIRRGTPAAWQ